MIDETFKEQGERSLVPEWALRKIARLRDAFGDCVRIAPGHVFDAIVLAADPSDADVFRRPGSVREVFQAGVAGKSGGDLLAERAAGRV